MYFLRINLLEKVDAKTMNDLALKQIKNQGQLLPEDHPIFMMLVEVNQPWDEKLSIQVIHGFQSWMDSTTTVYWNTLHYKKLLAAAAYRVHAHLLETLSRGWDGYNRLWVVWKNDVEGFLRVLRFRFDLMQELSEEN